MLEDVIKSYGGKEVSAMDVYIDMFKLGDGWIQQKGEPSGNFKANPIGYWRNNEDNAGHFRVLFEDTFEDTLKEMQEADFALLNGISYFGKRRDQNHASKMYAMIFDLDDVDDSCLKNFLHAALIKEFDYYPLPNYVILSGNNVHLYYIMERPVPLYPNLKLQLKLLKYALIDRMWNKYTSKSESKQKQGIFQPFRVVGGKTKPDAKESRVRAFLINSHPYNLNELGRYVPDEYKVDENKLFKESKMTLEQARKKYPEWYKKVVENKDRTPKKWDIQAKVHGDNPTALYDWWYKQIKNGATFGHRYFCIMCLVIYAVKCSVPYDKVKEDAYNLIPTLNDINPDEPFDEGDVDSALECYDDKYCTFPIRDIESISAIRIRRNKRNYRPQKEHMRRISALRDSDYPDGSWREGSGRKSKEMDIVYYAFEHPKASVTEIARALNVSRTTVYKYIKGNRTEPVMMNYEFGYLLGKRNGEAVIIEKKTAEDFEKQRAERVKAYYERMDNAKIDKPENE